MARSASSPAASDTQILSAMELAAQHPTTLTYEESYTAMPR